MYCWTEEYITYFKQVLLCDLVTMPRPFRFSRASASFSWSLVAPSTGVPQVLPAPSAYLDRSTVYLEKARSTFAVIRLSVKMTIGSYFHFKSNMFVVIGAAARYQITEDTKSNLIEIEAQVFLEGGNRRIKSQNMGDFCVYYRRYAVA